MRPHYQEFIDFILDERFNVIPVESYAEEYKRGRINVLLRHDLDDDNGLGFMELEAQAGLRSTYYVMANRSHVGKLLQCTYDVEQVAKAYEFFQSLGFRFGYHFKDVDEILGGRANRSMKPTEISAEDMNLAIASFRKNLWKLRQYVSIRSVAAHGGCCNWFLDCSPVWEHQWNEVSRLEGMFTAYRIPVVKCPQINDEYVSNFGVEYLRRELERFKAGDMVQVLIHPWRVRWEYPLIDEKKAQKFVR